MFFTGYLPPEREKEIEELRRDIDRNVSIYLELDKYRNTCEDIDNIDFYEATFWYKGVRIIHQDFNYSYDSGIREHITREDRDNICQTVVFFNDECFEYGPERLALYYLKIEDTDDDAEHARRETVIADYLAFMARQLDLRKTLKESGRFNKGEFEGGSVKGYFRGYKQRDWQVRG